MGWDRKERGARRGYFYKSVRVPGCPHPVKMYFGRKTAGKLAAAVIEMRREARLAAREALRAEREATAEPDRLAAELYGWADLLFSTWMVLTGHHLHHGSWRRRHMARKPPPGKGAAGPGPTRKPRVGSRAWEKTLATSTTYARSMIKTLTDRAKQGNAEAAERVLLWLEKFPELKGTVRELDDLTAKVEDAWVRALTGGDTLAERAARDEVAAMKAELLTPGAGVLERVLAGTVLVAYLAHQRAAVMAAGKSTQPSVAAMRDRRLTAAQKRLLTAVKAWETVARKKAEGVLPKRKLKLFEPEPGAA